METQVSSRTNVTRQATSKGRSRTPGLAGISRQHAWKTPVLRLIDTTVGVIVGISAAWICLKFVGPTLSSTVREKLGEQQHGSAL